MKFLSLCSGIEAASVAWNPLGWEAVAFAEIEKFPSAVLRHHYQHTPNHGDMTKYHEWPKRKLDVLIGGTPCQSFSIAGLRKGMADPRGNLALVFLGIVDRFQPTWVCWENVPGVHSSWSDETHRLATPETERHGREARQLAKEAGFDGDTAERFGEFEEVNQSNDFDCFLAALEQLGYGVATTILDAQFFGVAQRRERVFVVGHIGGLWQRAAAVLFDRTSMCGNPPPSREAGKRTAPTIRSGASNGGAGHGARSGDSKDELCIPINMQAAAKNGKKSPNMLGIGKAGDPSMTVNASDQHAVAIGFDSKQGGDTQLGATVQGMPPLKGMARHAVAHSLKADGFDASEDGTGRGTPLIPETSPAMKRRDYKGPSSDGDGDGLPLIPSSMAVRRLTPRECERLQGFPDDFTAVTIRNKTAADGPRYKALGNSMAVPVIEWIGRRIELVDELVPFTPK